ncbi:hypothetical protein CTAYLR_000190 [Chrysophaeum taylorii]|uniref:Anoctamin transmembrane domain-containing protein n=1 Tax=Chrysophaeum taylorii TaxID=2483200 RepID=A0AAD7XMB6_9STRA|nr:hypothetical protein CTAYLR_000190 [Chrysophaeum taylorii]
MTMEQGRRQLIGTTDFGQLIEGIVFLGILVLLGLSLYLVIMLARRFAKPRPKYIKPDPLFKDFDAGQNWSWDWVMVFRVQGSDEIVSRYQEQYSLRRIVERLNAGGLETKLFKSYHYDKIFCKIRCSLTRLKAQAAATDYPLLLDEDEVIKRLKRGYRDEYGELKWRPRDIVDVKRQCRYKYYEFIYGTFKNRPDLQNAYVTYPSSNSIFRGVDRLKLIMSIMQADIKQEGCSLRCNELVAKGACLAVYPLHDEEEIHALMNDWLAYFAMPWCQPIEAIKDYFGEKVGMYFLFLGSYATWLFVAAIFGTLVFLCTSWATPVTIFGNLFMAVAMSLWATFFLQSWKETQAKAKMEWGMATFEELEQVRTGFVGETINSPVTGLPEQYFPPSEKVERVIVSYVQIVLLMLYVTTINAGIFYAYAYISRFPYQQVFAFSWFPKSWNMPQILTHVTLALVIQCTNEFFMPLASYLNSIENHRTETQYEDNLIAKMFVFQFANSYGALFYIAIIQGPAPEHVGLAEPWRTTRFGCKPRCFHNVGALLGTIFLIRVVLGNILEVVVPYVQLRRRQLQEIIHAADTEEYENPFDAELMRKRQISPAEEQFEKSDYNNISLFNDYAELAIQFGYATLFVSAFPIAPLFACVNNIIEIRVDGWKLTQNTRRPWPNGAEDIGTWEDVLALVSIVATVSNIAMVTLNSPLFVARPTWERLVIFCSLECFLVGLKLFLAANLDEVPADVQIQNERQDFFARKIVLLERDDEHDEIEDGDVQTTQEPVVYSSDPQIVKTSHEEMTGEHGADH